MSYGANQAVASAEDAYREHCARLIAHTAAQFVAAGDMGRDEAVRKVAEWLQLDTQAEGDPTGVDAIVNGLPSPSRVAAGDQVAAIAIELLDAARAAANKL